MDQPNIHMLFISLQNSATKLSQVIQPCRSDDRGSDAAHRLGMSVHKMLQHELQSKHVVLVTPSLC